MVVPIRDIGNTTFSTLAIMILDSNMDILALGVMNINNFNIGSIDNFDDVREHMIFPNKAISRIVSMSSSKASKEYAAKVERLNSVPDNNEFRKPIDSSNLSYSE